MQARNEDPPFFSLVLGGPLYQLLLRTRLARPPLELLKRRILFLSLFCWLPLAIGSLLDGHFFNDIQMPFLRDIGTHVRFLFALPLLVAAELTVHHRLHPIVDQFVKRRIVTPEDRPKFESIMNSMKHMRNSVVAELVIIALVYSLGHFFIRSQVPRVDSWSHSLYGGTTLPGYWYAFVSIPILQFLLFRWYYRLLIWSIFLWRVARLNLILIPTHPDRVGGLGFLTASAHALSPLVLVHGCLLAATIANRIFFESSILTQFKIEIGIMAGFIFLLVFGPLVHFAPLLMRARREGLRRYGSLASGMVIGFEEKWLGNKAGRPETLLEVGDVQSLADLGTSFDIIRDMKSLPINKEVILQILFAFALPLFPLILTIVPAGEIFQRAIKILL